MRAVQFNDYGGPHVLHVGEVAEPHAGAGQVRVAVLAVGVNPIDWKLRSGRDGTVHAGRVSERPGPGSRRRG
jgi:NADPH:quinone reductase-like Zn-dependent oxidoreductase